MTSERPEGTVGHAAFGPPYPKNPGWLARFETFPRFRIARERRIVKFGPSLKKNFRKGSGKRYLTALVHLHRLALNPGLVRKGI